MKKKSTVCVVEDDAPVRESLAFLLRQHGFRVKSFATAQAFLDASEAGGPGCLILDVHLTDMSGLDLQECLAKRGIDIPILMISAFADAPEVVRAIQHGAVDFLEKPLDHRKLMRCVRKALALDVTRRRAKRDQRVLVERTTRLTPRETEIMHYVVAGLSNKKIGIQLKRSDKTVEIHRAQVMRKMEAHSLPDLVRMVEAFKLGSIEGSEPRLAASKR